MGETPFGGAASLKTQPLAVGHATRTTTNRCVNPARQHFEKTTVRRG
ncbi:hypothetical protein [Moorena sp. SIO4G3]|nr:hypothetical protein [Moorena sp. SIO4G3]NEO81857.1 hypothetical protein [Moorena sp. SIO4G3]